MKRYINWYILWFKEYWKRPSTWIQVLGMVFLLLILSSLQLPDGGNLQVGILGAEGKYGKRILEQLLTTESIFDFRQYEEEEVLKRDILSGKLECGFLFHQDFDEGVEKGDLKRRITFISTPLSVKGRVAKETVYARFFEVYSERMLKQEEDNIFIGEDALRTGELIRLKEYYADSDAVFQLETLWVETPDEMEQEALPLKNHPIQGMAGLLSFLLMLLSQGRKFVAEQCRVDKALNSSARFIFGTAEKLAAGTLPALAGWGSLLLLGEGRGALYEAGMLLLLLVTGSLWIMVVEKLFKKETGFVAGTLAITLICMFICPIWIDLGEIIPAISYLRLLFPVGIYLLG